MIKECLFFFSLLVSFPLTVLTGLAPDLLLPPLPARGREEGAVPPGARTNPASPGSACRAGAGAERDSLKPLREPSLQSALTKVHYSGCPISGTSGGVSPVLSCPESCPGLRATTPSTFGSAQAPEHGCTEWPL